MHLVICCANRTIRIKCTYGLVSWTDEENEKKHGLSGVLLLIIWWDENIWNVCDDIMDGYEMAAVSVRSAN